MDGSNIKSEKEQKTQSFLDSIKTLKEMKIELEMNNTVLEVKSA